MPVTVFSEHQRFALWVYVIAIAVACIGVGAIFIVEDTAGAKAVPPATVLCIAAMLLFLFDVLWLRVSVDRIGLFVCLGRPVPIVWKRIPLEAIHEVRVVTYHPILDAGGWGMRFGKFEGRFAIYWNARGDRGVLIDTDKRRYVIGSQEPEWLCAAIGQAMGNGRR